MAERRLCESVVDLDVALHEALDRIEARIEAGAGDIMGVPLGYPDVDEALLGLQPQGLYVVAAAPGHCKTSFVLGAATHVAMTLRRPVVFFSLEMSRGSADPGILASQARVDSRRPRTGKLVETDWPKMTERPQPAQRGRPCSSTRPASAACSTCGPAAAGSRSGSRTSPSSSSTT